MQRILFACVVLLAAALPCPAQGDKPKPNTLTPKEIADGWILLFDGETTIGWDVKGTKKNATLKITDGALDLSDLGDGAMRLSMFIPSSELHFDFKAERENEAQFTLLGPGSKKPEQSMAVRMGLPLRRTEGWGHFVTKIDNGRAKMGLSLKGMGAQTGCDWTEPAQFEIRRPGGTNLKIQNVKYRPLNTKPLFNSKDLTGWKEFPGKKSKFTVTDSGEINVKDGPGDLQTVGKFKDFILQLECKSNGKHLNSGIFFRCRDNEYQNGYEAQIRNQFTKEPTQKYQIEEYDPMTNKLIGKKEILATAVDYGTGAIYRRMPARKEMAKDGEWFTMTIVAHGNHFATWVNGVQVVDWTDNRPKSDNARTGCKLDAGHISIQGHDPTTDLSFRNIRIAEFK